MLHTTISPDPTAETTVATGAIIAAGRALKTAHPATPARLDDDPIPEKARNAASRSVRRLNKSRSERRLVQTDWMDRPEEWRPYASWDEAQAAWCSARQASMNAFVACRRVSTPFINDPKTDPRLKNAYIFTRTADEAFEKAPDLPADLIETRRAEEVARDVEEFVRKRATQTPASGMDILAKVRLITAQIDDVFDPLEVTDVREAHKHPDSFSTANEFFALNDDIIRAVSSAGDGDAEILSMSRELAHRFQVEIATTGDDAAIDAAIEHSASMAHAIMGRPARSVADFRAKAEVVKWACNGRAELDEAFAGGAKSSNMLFAHQILCELLDGSPEAPYGRLDRREDPWAAKLQERNRIVHYVNTTVGTLPDDADEIAFFDGDMTRQWALVTEIDEANSLDPQVRAAQIRLCLKLDEEGFDMSKRAFELLRKIEATLPPMPGEVIQ